MLVAAVCSVIPSKTENDVLFGMTYSQALHYEMVYYFMKGVKFNSRVNRLKEIDEIIKKYEL